MIQYEMVLFKKKLRKGDFMNVEERFNLMARYKWRFVRFVPVDTTPNFIALFERAETCNKAVTMIEYKLLQFKRKLDHTDVIDVNKKFNRLARNKWQFVRFVPIDTTFHFTALFQRQRQRGEKK